MYFNGEFDFVTDAYPSRKSYSFYGQTTYSSSDNMRYCWFEIFKRFIFKSDVTNFFNIESYDEGQMMKKLENLFENMMLMGIL